MNQQQAETIAELYQGMAVQWIVGCDEWQVIVQRPDDSVVVFSDDVICMYADADEFGNGEETIAIALDNF